MDLVCLNESKKKKRGSLGLFTTIPKEKMSDGVP